MSLRDGVDDIELLRTYQRNKERRGWRQTCSRDQSIEENKDVHHPSIHIYLSIDLCRRRIEQEQGGVERSLVDLSSYLTCIHLEKIVMDNSIRSRERSELR